MASTDNPNAARRLDILRSLRLRGQAPVGAICVATEKADVALFEEIKRPVIEVWRRDAGSLDWTPVAGLWVYVVIRDWSHELRMQLFESIRAAEPAELNWLATAGRREIGSLWLIGGEPREMWRPGPKGGEYSYGRV